ncbi:ABC transporter ATP-binding protein [Candidatus Falkowbacteria bacterium]|jgi:ABC-type multidrug transport system fused ATPase/permease subunit|nr:ABC transporter ATP-binding protein [Candidatus Falkowbacteria bacterium]MBT7007726.1 ABC transporter ATP-binding protein [Candidatus Falkowbacteria bacterium]
MSMDFDEKSKETSFSLFLKGMKTLYELLVSYRRRLAWILIVMFIVQSLHIVFPYLLKMIFDELPKVIADGLITNRVIILLVGLFAIKITNDFIWHFVHMINYKKLAIDLENDLPARAQEKLLELSVGFHERENTGKKVSKIEKGIDRTLQIIHSLFWDFFPPIIYMSINLVFLLLIDWRIGAMFLIAIIPGVFIYKFVYDKYIADWDIWEEKKELAIGMFCQSILNINTVQNFVQERREVREHANVRNDMKRIDRKLSIKIEKLFSLISITFNFGFILTICTTLYLVSIGEVSVGTLVFLIATGSVMLSQIWALMDSYTNAIRRIYSILRMKKLLDEQPEIVNHENAIIPESYQGVFTVKEMDFSYPEKQEAVLRKFNLTIHPKQMVALVGKSGEGKTTLIKLLCRMYDIETGVIQLDGTDIKQLDLHWYKKLFAIVKQDVEIFDGTILQNICYACCSATQDQVDEALLAAHLSKTLSDTNRFPDGLNTQVGERGVKLSGGEKQRVGIARAYIALLNGAKVLVLDEATSNLDSEAECAIQEMINSVREKLNISIVAIAHRLSTIRRSDMIYVINGGKIVEKGNHERLLAGNGLYSSLVDLQRLGALRD